MKEKNKSNLNTPEWQADFDKWIEQGTAKYTRRAYDRDIKYFWQWTVTQFLSEDILKHQSKCSCNKFHKEAKRNINNLKYSYHNDYLTDFLIPNKTFRKKVWYSLYLQFYHLLDKHRFDYFNYILENY